MGLGHPGPGAPQKTPSGKAHGGEGGSRVLAPVLALGREKQLERKETLSLSTRLSSPFPHRSVVCAPCPQPVTWGRTHRRRSAERLQDEGSCRTAGGTRVWAGVELRALGAIATAVRGFTSGALRDLTYDLSHLPLSRPSLGEDACPGHSPSWENS